MPEELSAADTYRVSFSGRALMRCPGILLLDRTIAEADPDVQEVMRKILQTSTVSSGSQ